MPTEIEALADILKRSLVNVPAQVLDLPDGRTFAISRNDFKLENITPANKAQVMLPQIVSQTVRVQTAASLVDYANRFKNAHSMLFADMINNSMHVAIDYHQAPAEAPTERTEPRAMLCKHNAHLALPFSEAWQTWVAQDERLIPHVAFASFLEENAVDVVDPKGGDLYEIIRDIQVKQDMHFASSIRMGDAVSITYSKDEDATTKANMELPIHFTISIPVYVGEGDIKITCLMRRKIADGKLHLGFKMMRLEEARQREFERVVMRVAGLTNMTPIYGATAV